MRVLVFDGPHSFHLEDRPTPEPAPGEVRIRIARVGICGSDLHGYTGESGRRVAGMVMGHEASGWVDAVGADVVLDGIEVGDVVTFNPVLACDGECGHGAANRCTRMQVIGVTPELQGAFAEFLVVPADRVVGVEPMPLEWAAGVEPMAVGLQAVRRLGVADGDEVLVIGGGMIGLCAAQAARLEGAVSVTISDPLAERRAAAAATGFAAATPEDVSSLGPFTKAIDAVGIDATAAAAITSVCKGGRVCFVGLGGPQVSIPLFEVVVSERAIVGTFAYTDEVFRETTEHLKSRNLDLAQLIGEIVPMEDIAAAFEDLARGTRRDAKIMMTTDASAPASN